MTVCFQAFISCRQLGGMTYSRHFAMDDPKNVNRMAPVKVNGRY